MWSGFLPGPAFGLGGGDDVGWRCCACHRVGRERIAHKNPSCRPTPVSHRCGPATGGETRLCGRKLTEPSRRADEPNRRAGAHARRPSPGRSGVIVDSSLRTRGGGQLYKALLQDERQPHHTIEKCRTVASDAGLPWLVLVSRGRWGSGGDKRRLDEQGSMMAGPSICLADCFTTIMITILRPSKSTTKSQRRVPPPSPPPAHASSAACFSLQ